MAPGPDGTLFVSIPRSGGSVLALLDRTGRSRRGWPIAIKDSTECGFLSPPGDGSVRVVCTMMSARANALSPIAAFAFDPNGRSLAGWPVDLGDYGVEGYGAGRVIGDELTMYAWATLGDGREPGSAWVMTVAADGTVRNGTKVPFGSCCGYRWAVGPDGVAYGTNRFGEAPPPLRSSELLAVGFAGALAGFPIAIGGLVSEPSFDAAGRIHVTGATEASGRARTFVFDPDGRAVGGSGKLGVRATDECVGIEGSCEVPSAPLVGADGTTFVIEADYQSTIVAGLSPSGQPMTGWPYRSDAGHQGIGYCPAGAACDSYNLALPAIGPGNTLYLIHAAARAIAGGSLVAVGPDGRIRSGWPVELKRPGGAFWSVIVGTDGTAYALAIEPETDDSSSATVLAISPDGTVRYRTTIVDP